MRLIVILLFLHAANSQPIPSMVASNNQAQLTQIFLDAIRDAYNILEIGKGSNDPTVTDMTTGDYDQRKNYMIVVSPVGMKLLNVLQAIRSVLVTHYGPTILSQLKNVDVNAQFDQAIRSL